MIRHNQSNDLWFVDLVQRGQLSVSKNGVVLNTKTNRIIGATGSGGYPKISMQDPVTKKIRSMQIHRLVWIVYKGKVPKNKILNHKDGVKTNSKLSNLELVTESENVRHALQNGLTRVLKGEERSNSAFSDALVVKLRKKFALARGKLTARSGAKKFGVSNAAFTMMLTGKTYSHITTGFEYTCADILKKNSRGRCISQAMQRKIKKLHSEGKSVYKIAEELGLARNTVMKYW